MNKMECPYCHHNHFGEKAIAKIIHCKYRWQNRELMAMMKASNRLGELEDLESQSRSKGDTKQTRQ
jgi:hypothetical protein